MNDNDMNEMIKKAQSMIQNNQIPDDIKTLINNFQNSNSNNFSSSGNTNNNVKNNTFNSTNNKNHSNFNPTNNRSNYNSNFNSTNNRNNYNSNYNKPINSNSSNTSNNFNDSTNSNSNNSETKMPDIDIETMMKIQKIMSQMKSSNDDDMSKLLMSLKPYLRDTKKEKLDEYMKLIKMGKMTQLFNSFGGDQKY